MNPAPVSAPLPEIEVAETDVLVLGGGLAGFRAAVAAREQGAGTAIAYYARGASPFVIGANVPLGDADPSDSVQQFIDDMLDGGYGINDRRLVEALAHSAVPAFRALVDLGVPFARQDGRFLQRHLSGNTYPRSVYIPEGTGRVVIEHLAEHAREIGITEWAGWRVVSLLSDGDEVAGCLMLRPKSGELIAVHARTVVLAMGGIGRLYEDSTYPSDVSADAYALSLEAGASLIDMEFVQFEPVVTVSPEACRSMEMPTAMLGDGARLINARGERFMFRYNPEHGEKRLEKARLSLCIQQEIDEGRGFPEGTVLFDTTTVPRDRLESYVSHCKRLRAAGLDPTEQGPQVRPAAHSEMGGVFIDADGWSGVPGLYACGEASGGVHGASRLAGNGGGETFAMGWAVGRSAAVALAGAGPAPRRNWHEIHRTAAAALLDGMGEARGTGPEDLKRELRSIMGESAGLYRTAEGLERGLAELEALDARAAELRAPGIEGAAAVLSARNMLLTARTILGAALARQESRGAHQRRDFPQSDEAWRKHIAFRLDRAGQLVRETLAIH